jgi:hypothetical protein
VVETVRAELQENPEQVAAAINTAPTEAVATVFANAAAAGNTEAVATAAAIGSTRNTEATSTVLAQASVQAATQGSTQAFASASAQAFSIASTRGIVESFVTSFAQASSKVATASVEAAAATFAQTAIEATTRGVVEDFSRSQSQALAVAQTTGGVEAYAYAIADAITQGGEATTQAYAVAFAQATAAGGDQAAGLTQAIAIVSCQGGARAEAFAEALSRTIGTDSNGCTILREARSTAFASCGPEGAFASANTEVTRRVIGLCRDRGFTDFSYPGLSDFDNIFQRLFGQRPGRRMMMQQKGLVSASHGRYLQGNRNRA